MPTVPSNDQATRWFVFSVSYKKEMDLCDDLRSAGIDCYVPLRFTLRTVGSRKVRRQQPAIYGLVFARGTRQQLLDFREGCQLAPYIFLQSNRLSDGTLRYACVDDDEMDNFRKLNDVAGAKITYYKPEELLLAKGEKVKIMDGPFEGVTGIVQKLPRKRGQYLVVSLTDIAVAAVNIKPEYILPLSHKVPKSTDVVKDSKRLARLALGIIGGNTRQEALVMDEMAQLEASIEGCKTYLPNDRANYHFALYASALATKKPTEAFRAELAKVLPRLKPNNLLLPMAHILLYKDTGEEAERMAAETIIAKWDRTRYTDPQRQIMKLWQAVIRKQSPKADDKACQQS